MHQSAFGIHRSVHTQKHLAAQKSRLPEIPLLSLLSLAGRERVLPEQLISATYPTCASAAVAFCTERRLSHVGNWLPLAASSTSSSCCYFFPFPLQLFRKRTSTSAHHTGILWDCSEGTVWAMAALLSFPCGAARLSLLLESKAFACVVCIDGSYGKNTGTVWIMFRRNAYNFKMQVLILFFLLCCWTITYSQY